VIPDDDAQGRALGDWTKRLGFKRVQIDRGPLAFSDSIRGGFEATANALVVGRGPRDAIVETADAQHEPAAIYSGPEGFMGPVLGTDALIPPWNAGDPTRVDYAISAALDPSQLPAAGQKFVRDFRARYGHQPSRYAAYGYEAMAVVLDAIDRAAGDSISRQGVIDAFFNTLDRQSILGTYSIDAVGNTTLDRMTGYRVRGGRLEPIATVTAH
jgi:branched-chain amino acid transport system substrate-binding protein